MINLVIDESRAVTGNNARGMTTTTEFHDWDNDTQTFRLWDTPGLSEGLQGVVSPKRAQDAIRSLLTELSNGGGVHLLVHCMRGLPRVIQDMKLTYDAIVRIRDEIAQDVPLVAIITELEQRSDAPDTIHSMDEWMTEHTQELVGFNMAYSAHACITTLPDDSIPKLPGRLDLCQALVRRLIVQAHSPKLARNIVIVGEIGAGKSSLVNLVLSSQKAVVRHGLRSGTDVTRDHDWEINHQTFRLWDTPGLEEELHGSGSEGWEALQLLFTHLKERGGVHLLIICVRGVSEITMASKKTYKNIKKMHARFCPATPVVAVITELEGLSTTDNPLSMEGWWTTNSGTFSDLALSGHACITTSHDDDHPNVPGRQEMCRKFARDLIIDQSLQLRTLPPKDLHVLLFGETGVGKSSLVNLLAGWQIALVSPNSAPCTLDSTEYQFQFGSTTIRLWDTVGLEEPEKGPHGYVGAIEKAVQLIRRLEATGGISLFLFCMRGNRITATTKRNYRLFYEVLGKKKVPIAFVVTQLERQAGEMEDWWRQNSKTLKKEGMVSAEHACITALEGHPRYAESRGILRGLLSRFDDQGRFSMPPEAWISRVLNGLNWVFEMGFPGGNDLVNILTKRCFLATDVAQRVAACIDGDRSSGRTYPRLLQ